MINKKFNFQLLFINTRKLKAILSTIYKKLEVI